MKKICILVSCLVLAALGCEKGDGTDSPDKLTIALIPKCTTMEFWKTVNAGGVKAEQELGIELLWKGPIKEDDREQQIQVVENFVSRGVDGIVLAPLDNTALRAPVSYATRSGIPVIIIDSAINSDDHISFVATNNYEGGKLAGEHMAKLLGGEGKVVILRYLEGSASTTKRESGFIDAIKEHPGIRIVVDSQYAGPTTETAYQASENMLAPLTGQDGELTIDGVFCPSETTTFGMLRALQDGGHARKVRFIGFDFSDKLVQALRDGDIDALIIQDPMNMGYLGVKTMIRHLKGETVESRVDTGATVVTKENMDQPEIKNLIDPDLDKWLK